jgi:hypothetical protein
MNPAWGKQILAVLRLEIRKSFFSKRGLWIYLLAAFPLLIFGGHSFDVQRTKERRARAALLSPGATIGKMRQIKPEMKREEVIAILGQPASEQTFRRRRGEFESLSYSDGNSELFIRLQDGEVQWVNFREGCNFTEDINIFAGVFQLFFLRLAIFFGCVFVFINLFRGEMLDKSLHYYFLAPVRREVVVIGKYLAGLVATCVIFCTSVALQLLFLNLHFEPAVLEEYITRGHAWQHAFAYMGVTALACVGYGSVFLAGGILLRNPLIPAATILLWESINGILPSILRKFSVIYYLKSLCPVPLPLTKGVPPPLALLAMNVSDASPLLAIGSLCALAAALLLIAAHRARTLEINYGTE